MQLLRCYTMILFSFVLSSNDGVILFTFVFEHQIASCERSCHLSCQISAGIGCIDLVGGSVHRHVLRTSPVGVV